MRLKCDCNNSALECTDTAIGYIAECRTCGRLAIFRLNDENPQKPIWFERIGEHKGKPAFIVSTARDIRRVLKGANFDTKNPINCR